jgi:hypothetical protein
MDLGEDRVLRRGELETVFARLVPHDLIAQTIRPFVDLSTDDAVVLMCERTSLKELDRWHSVIFEGIQNLDVSLKAHGKRNASDLARSLLHQRSSSFSRPPSPDVRHARTDVPN